MHRILVQQSLTRNNAMLLCHLFPLLSANIKNCIAANDDVVLLVFGYLRLKEKILQIATEPDRPAAVNNRVLY